MAKAKRNFLPVLLSAAGAVGAFFGVRALRSYLQQRDSHISYSSTGPVRAGDFTGTTGVRSTPAGRRQPVDQPDRGVPTIANVQEGERIEEELYITPDPIPTTGPAAAPSARERTGPVSEMVRDLSVPLAAALMGLHDMIERLRERRRDGNYAGPTGLSLTPDDRSRFSEVVDQLDSHLGGYDPARVSGDTLAERAYGLVTKIREAMQDTSYNDNDLFRIHGEVQTEICQLLPNLPENEFAEVTEAYT